MENKIVIFDFDGTLTPHTLPKFEILEKCGYSNGLFDVKFLSKVIARAPKCVDIYHALYETILSIISASGLPVNDDTISLGVENVVFIDGVVELLTTLKNSGVQSYILSSGLKPYLEKSKIGGLVSGIFATTFSYNFMGNISGIRFCMTSKRKVNAIKAILKNNGISEKDTSNVIYVGDGLTDFFAFSYVKKHGGTSIFVYDNTNKKDLEILKERDVLNCTVEKNYSMDSQLSTIIMNHSLNHKSIKK